MGRTYEDFIASEVQLDVAVTACAGLPGCQIDAGLADTTLENSRKAAQGKTLSSQPYLSPYTFEILDGGAGELRGTCRPSALGHCVLIGGLCPTRPDAETPLYAMRPASNHQSFSEEMLDLSRKTDPTSKTPAELHVLFDPPATPEEIDASEAAQTTAAQLQRISLKLTARATRLRESGAIDRFNAISDRHQVSLYAGGGFGTQEYIAWGGEKRHLAIVPIVLNDDQSLKLPGNIIESDQGPAFTSYTKADIEFWPDEQGTMQLKGIEKPVDTPSVTYAGGHYGPDHKRPLAGERIRPVAAAIFWQMHKFLNQVELAGDEPTLK